MSAVAAHQPLPACAAGHAALPVANRHTAADAFRAAMARARKSGVEVKRTSPTTWVAESTSRPGLVHTVEKFGPKWHDLRCSCEGNSISGAVCQHMALSAASDHYNLPRIAFKKPAPAIEVVEQAVAVAAAAPVLCSSCHTDPATESGQCEGCAAAVHGPVQEAPTSLEVARQLRRAAYRETQVALRLSGVDPLLEAFVG